MTVFPSSVCLIHESKTGHSILLCSDSSSKETLCIKTPVSSPVRNKLHEKENTSVPQFTPVAEMRQPAVIATLRMTLDPLALRLCFSTDLPLYQILQSLQYYDSFFPLKSQSISPFFSFLALFSKSAVSVPSIRQGFVQNAPKPAKIQGFWRKQELIAEHCKTINIFFIFLFPSIDITLQTAYDIFDMPSAICYTERRTNF